MDEIEIARPLSGIPNSRSILLFSLSYPGLILTSTSIWPLAPLGSVVLLRETQNDGHWHQTRRIRTRLTRMQGETDSAAGVSPGNSLPKPFVEEIKCPRPGHFGCSRVVSGSRVIVESMLHAS